MKVLTVAAPGVLQVQEMPFPEPGPYDALCRTTYATICAGTDSHVIDGTFGPRRFPAVIGHESIGEVIDVGARVTMFRPGDLVTRVSIPPSADGSYELAWGGMTEFAIARDHEALRLDGEPESTWGPSRVNQVIRTRRLTGPQTPMFITWRETYSYTRRLGVTAGSRVVVSGSGANGLSIASMARVLGAAEVVVIGSASRIAAAHQAGGSLVIAYTDDTAVDRFVTEWRASVDVLIDATGISHSLDRLLPTIAPTGVVGVYGLDDAENYGIDPLRASSFRFLDPGYDEAEGHDAIEAAIEAGLLDPTVWIDDTRLFGWAHLVDAYQAARDRSLIKPVIDMRSPL